MLFLTEADVIDLFPMTLAIERVESSLVAQHKGEATNRARQRIFLLHSSLHYMAAALPAENLLGMKVYTVSQNVLRFVVLLYDAASGELLAFLEADHLGRIRTGAASGVATKYMAREGSSQVGVIGTGRQARTQLEAVAAVTRVARARVFGRDEARRHEFARQMSERLGFAVDPVADAEAAVRDADVVITATASSQPVLHGDWLRPAAHVNAIGANHVKRRELDDRAIARAGVIAVDSLEQAREESGDLIHGLAARPAGWDDVCELHEIVGGSRRGRNSADEITIFKSNGIAIWDVSAAGAIYRRALEQGRGREIELGKELR